MGFGPVGGGLEEGVRQRDSALDWMLLEAGLVLGCSTRVPRSRRGKASPELQL